MSRRVIHVTALAAVLVSGAALAQGGMGPDYVKMDKDRDGTLQKREVVSNKALAKQWDTLDVNRDGKLDEAEFAQFEPESISQDSMRKDTKDAKPKY